jgi:hypothetical protein
MQVVLLSVSAMYFVLGSTLEYVRRSDILITSIVLIFGIFKVAVSIISIISFRYR